MIVALLVVVWFSVLCSVVSPILVLDLFLVAVAFSLLFCGASSFWFCFVDCGWVRCGFWWS